MKISIIKDGIKQIVKINPYNGDMVWVEFDNAPGRRQLFQISELKQMFKDFYDEKHSET